MRLKLDSLVTFEKISEKVPFLAPPSGHTLHFDPRSQFFLKYSENPPLLFIGWVQTSMGGPNAEITTEQSAADLLDVIEKATKEHSGAYLRNKMEVLPF